MKFALLPTTHRSGYTPNDKTIYDVVNIYRSMKARSFRYTFLSDYCFIVFRSSTSSLPTTFKNTQFKKHLITILLQQLCSVKPLPRLVNSKPSITTLLQRICCTGILLYKVALHKPSPKNLLTTTSHRKPSSTSTSQSYGFFRIQVYCRESCHRQTDHVCTAC